MIRINLLQERKAPAAGKAKSAGPSVPGAFQAYALLGLFVGGAAFASAAIWWWQSSKIKELDRLIAADTKRQQDLMAIKKQVDEFQAKKTLLENKVTLIETLRLEQKGPVHMLDEISKALSRLRLAERHGPGRGGPQVQGRGQRPDRGGRLHQRPPAQRLVPAADLGTSQSTKENLYTFEVTAQFKDPEVAAKEKEMKEKQAAADAAAAAARAAKKGKK